MPTVRQRQIVAAAIASGTEPKINRNEDVLTLTAGNGRVFLEKRGKITAVGKYYYEQTNAEAVSRTAPPTDWTSTRIHTSDDGSRRYVIGADGRKTLLMCFDPTTREARLTK